MLCTPGPTALLKRHKLLGVKACLGLPGKAAFLEGLCRYQHDHGIRHGSEPGSEDEDRMSALEGTAGSSPQVRVSS